MTLADSANRDEALRCLKFARAALVEGNKAKAKKLAEKSRQMCRTDECDGKLVYLYASSYLIYLTVEFLRSLDDVTEPKASPSPTHERQSKAAAHTTDTDNAKADLDYTVDQKAAVER